MFNVNLIKHKRFTNDLDVVGYVHKFRSPHDHIFPCGIRNGVVAFKVDGQFRNATEENGR